MSNFIKIGDHIRIIPGFPFSSSKFNNDGYGLPLIRIRDLLDSTTNTYFKGEYAKEYIIEKGDILIGMDGDFHIVRWQSNRKALLNQRIMKVAQKEGAKININFFYFFLFPFLKDVWEKTTATTVKHLSTYDVSEAIIEFPPLPQQTRIAHILSTCDRVIEKTQVTITKYKSIKQGLLHDLFSRGIDLSTGKLRPKYEEAPELYMESKLGMVPKEWYPDSLNKLCYLNPVFNPPSKLHSNTEVTFFRMEDVSNDAEIINHNTKKLSKVSKKGFTPFIENDILFAKITPCMENGKGALAKGLKNSIGFGSTEFHVLRPMDDRSTLFLFYLTTSRQFRIKAEGKMSGSASQQRVPTSFLQEYQIAIPPIDEQFAIGLRIDAVNQNVQTEQNYLAKLQSLKQGLMADLLSSKKRVKINKVELA